MNKRQFLTAAVSGLLGLVVLSFLWVLLSGIKLSSVENSKDRQPKLLKDLKHGEVVLRRYQGNAVWVLRLSESQQAQAPKLETYVVKTQGISSACHEINEYCVLLAKTKRDGINIHYTSKAPAQLPSDFLWYGGFVNPTNGALYDFLGRAYKGQSSSESMTTVSFN